MRSGKKSSRGGGVAQSDRLSKHCGQFARSIGLGAALNYSRRMAMSYRTGVITSDEFGRQAQTFDHWVEKADDQVRSWSRSCFIRQCSRFRKSDGRRWAKNAVTFAHLAKIEPTRNGSAAVMPWKKDDTGWHSSGSSLATSFGVSGRKSALAARELANQ